MNIFSTETFEGNPYVQTVATIPVANHEILLFPSYLPHSVPDMATTKDRWCLAFNTVPKVLGSRNTLTELLINPDIENKIICVSGNGANKLNCIYIVI